MSSQVITALLNSVIESASTVIPLNITTGSPTLVTAPYNLEEMGVLIGVTGDLRGRLLLDSNTSVFSGLAESMYGMALSGDMLESFTGEIGNMIAGNMATRLSEKSIGVDITPPTVMMGHTKLTGFKKAIQVSLSIAEKGDLKLILIFEE
jgi:chemotaxis protein CheX